MAVDRLSGFTQGVAVKPACIAASTTHITLSGVQSVDGVTVGNNSERVLVPYQESNLDNGIYISNTSSWQRATDADGAKDLAPGTLVFTRSGSAFAGRLWTFNAASTKTSLVVDEDDLRLTKVDVATVDLTISRGIEDTEGDGVTDDTSAIAVAVAGGGVIDGQNKVYKCTADISVPEDRTTIRNATFDFSSLQGGSGGFVVAGEQGTAVALTANASIGDTTLTVTSTLTFAANGWAWLTCDRVYSNNTELGQLVRVKSIASGTVLNLYDPLQFDFPTANTATAAPVTPKTDIRFENVRFIGSNRLGDGQIAVDAELADRVSVTDCYFDGWDHAGVQLTRCGQSNIKGCFFNRSLTPDLGAGVVVKNGCYETIVTECSATEVNSVARADSDDGVNYKFSVSACHSNGTKNAGVDATDSVYQMTVVGCTIISDGDASGDGIRCQGLNFVATGNTVVGAQRHGILHQVSANIGDTSCVISNNAIRDCADGSQAEHAGIYVVAQPLTTGGGAGSLPLKGVTITGNVVKDGVTDYGILIQGVYGDVNDIVVTGNSIDTSQDDDGIRVRAQNATTISNVVIGNNRLQGDLKGANFVADSSAVVSAVRMNGNHATGSSADIAITRVTNFYSRGNLYDTLTDTGSSVVNTEQGYTSSDISWVSSGTAALSHNLGVYPTRISPVIVFESAEPLVNAAAGTIMPVDHALRTNLTIFTTSSNSIRYKMGSSGPTYLQASTNSEISIDSTLISLRIKAWAD